MYGFLLVFFSNFVPKTHRFLRYSTCKYTVTLKPGLGSLKVIENYTMQSGAHDFLLTFHSNHRPISHRFRDKRRYPSKIARKSPIFPTPVYLTPRWRSSPWNCVSAQESQETRMMVLSDGRKRFQIGLAVFIQYRRVTDTHPATHPARHVTVARTALRYRVAQLKGMDT